MKKPIHDIDLRLLRIFREVARQQSFSGASESLNTSLSNISMRIAELESRLGMRLCERGVKGFKLTEQGRAVLEASEELYGSMDAYQARIDEISENVHTEYRLGVLSELVVENTVPLPGMLESIEEASPGCGFQLDFGAANQLINRVEADELHAAITYFDELPDTLSSVHLGQQRHLCYCSSQHELFTLPDNELADIELSEFRIAGYDDLFDSEKETIPLFVKYDACSRTGEGILALVLTGNYLGILVDSFAEPYVRSGHLRAIEKPGLALTVDIELIYKTSRAKTSIISTILNSIP